MTSLRESLHQSRAEAESLRLDLGEATALIEGLESELCSITTRWRGPDSDQYAAGAIDLLIRARTLIRRTLLQELGAECGHAALRDLRIAEVAFRFLLGLRSLQASGSPFCALTPRR